jgi:hypothetical protein
VPACSPPLHRVVPSTGLYTHRSAPLDRAHALGFWPPSTLDPTAQSFQPAALPVVSSAPCFAQDSHPDRTPERTTIRLHAFEQHAGGWSVRPTRVDPSCQVELHASHCDGRKRAPVYEEPLARSKVYRPVEPPSTPLAKACRYIIDH